MRWRRSSPPSLRSRTFCERHLDNEYRALIHRVIGALARKRPSPPLNGSRARRRSAEDEPWRAIEQKGRSEDSTDIVSDPFCAAQDEQSGETARILGNEIARFADLHGLVVMNLDTRLKIGAQP